MVTDPLAFDPGSLCARILKGDPAAEAELIDRFLPRVRAMVAIRTGDRDAAEDLGHEIMIEALCALRRETPREPAMLPAFVFGISRNLINGHVRTKIRHRNGDLSLAESIPAGNAIAREREMVDDARREIESLDAPDREVLDLSFSEGMEPAEIALRLRIPAATVRQRKARALKRLLERLSRKRPGAPL
jgi:RNA polymerase sigma factor (sigma-70 family)